MKVVVASQNPVKLNAVREAFASQFPKEQLEFVPTAAQSGVSDQPKSDDETRLGARNRAANASSAMPEAEFWVGLEGGPQTVAQQLMAFAWMSIRGPTGQIGEARSVTLPLPPAVKQLVDSGLELGDANDKVFGTVNSKQQGGAYGLLTNGRYTRESVYCQTLIIALIPFVNELFAEK